MLINKKIITLHGAFAGSNFGDLLLLQLQLSWLAEAGTTEVCLPTASQKALELIAVPNGLAIKDYCSDIIIFGGGGYFGSPNRAKTKWIVNWYRYHAMTLAKAGLKNRKVFLVGTGVGPLPFLCQYLLKNTLRRAEIIQPRDEESASYLNSLLGVKANSHIDIGTDLALCLANNKPNVSNHYEKTEILGIHLAPPLDDQELFQEFIESLSVKLSSYDISLRILVDQKGTKGAWRQREIGNRIAALSGLQYDVVELKSVDQFVKGIAECRRIITSKLHVGIVGRCFEIPVFSIPTHLKTVRFYRQIGELKYCKPWGETSMSELLEEICSWLSESDQSVLPKELVLRAISMKKIFGKIASEV